MEEFFQTDEIICPDRTTWPYEARMVQVDQRRTNDANTRMRVQAPGVDNGLDSRLVHFPENEPLELDWGVALSPF